MNELEKNTSLLRNISILGLMQIFNYISPLIMLVFLTKILGKELYGIVAFSMGLTIFSALIMDFGCSTFGTAKVAQKKNCIFILAKFTGAILILKLALFALISILIAIFSVVNEKYNNHYILIQLTLVPILFQGLNLSWFFLGIEKMKYVFFYGAAIKITFLTLALIFVKNKDDYHLIPLSNGLASLIGLILIIYFFLKEGYYIAIPRKKYLLSVCKKSIYFALSKIFATIYTTSNILILGLFSTPAVTANYSIAETIYKAIQAVFYPVFQSLLPFVSNKKNRLFIYKKIMFLSFALSIFIGILCYFTSPFLIYEILGKNWASTIPILNVFLFSLIFHVLAVMFGFPLGAMIKDLNGANASSIVGLSSYLLALSFLHINSYINEITIIYCLIIAEASIFLQRLIYYYPKVFIHSHETFSKS